MGLLKLGLWKYGDRYNLYLEGNLCHFVCKFTNIVLLVFKSAVKMSAVSGEDCGDIETNQEGKVVLFGMQIFVT